MMASILVVDDNPETVRPLARLLRYMGHEPSIATSGQEALGYLNMVRPHLVVLDVSMPVMDGLQVLEEIRKMPGLEGVPVVMYSALSDEVTRRKAMALGARDYLVKGWTDLGELQATIDANIR